MLESGEVLRTWALAAPLAVDEEIEAEALGDHRLVYLEFEGPISGDRGVVHRVAAGDYSVLEESPLRLVVSLAGDVVCGELTLERSTESSSHWRAELAGEAGDG